MFKWVIGLCAAMYLVLVTFGEPTPEELAAREAARIQEVTKLEVEPLVTPELTQTAAAAPTPEPAALVSVSQTVESPALVAASTETTAPAASTPVETVVIETAPEADAEIEQASAASTGNPIWRVTARAVNLRSGPSTNNPVVGRASRNDSAEIIQLLPSGWAKVYVLETGTEAYISAQFLAAPE